MIKIIEGGLLGSNTYVVYNKVGGSAMIVDCGCKAFSSVDFVNKSGLTVKYIVLTHGHFDHAEYTCEYVSAFPDAEIICHVDELKVLLDPNANLSSFVSEGKPYRFSYKTVCDGDEITLPSNGNGKDLTFKIIHSPGHTPGSICLLCESDGIMLTGDTLFKGGYGRTDFMYGSSLLLRDSLRRLLSLDGNIKFYAGHGEPSTIFNERY